MSMIQISNLNFTWPGNTEPVFENASFQIDSSWKLGLIGRNGAGKSTLFYLLCHPQKFPGILQSKEVFEVFPYTIPKECKSGWDLFHTLNPFEEDWQIQAELALMNADERILEQDLDEVSPGERMKIMLACLFVQPDRFLLLDEPFSFLDDPTRKQMKEYLKHKQSYILVSHDRDLLEECTDHILSLEKRGIRLIKGRYSAWEKDRQDYLESEKQKNKKLKGEITRLEKSQARSLNWSRQAEKGKMKSQPNEKLDRGFASHKAAKLMKRTKNLERRLEQSVQERKSLLHESDEIEPLKISCLQAPVKVLAKIDIKQAWYGDHPVYDHPLRLEIHPGERIALTGANGSGKSTLLELLKADSHLERPLQMEGEIRLWNGLVISYVSQEMTNLQGSFQNYIGKHHIDRSLFFTILRKMGFEREVFEHNLDDLSQGQKKKVALARSICTPAHLYIWDEPLNYLDILSRIQIEQMILAQQPTMIYVEHDQTFISRTATRIVNLSCPEQSGQETQNEERLPI